MRLRQEMLLGASTCLQGRMPLEIMSLIAFDIITGVFFAGLFEVNIINIGQRAKPSENISKLQFLFFLIRTGQRRRKLANLFNEP